ncbi:Glycosyltransferase involved in cell wall bisynthesis [Spirosomataceae bacterium TFI 002]|nr:Glycosyltransferase involved in cell wall bisynthesis [Spirosomataceae bacterium TFI 002]
MSTPTTILIPVYNDWEALGLLLTQIDHEALRLGQKFDVLLMNDCSADEVKVDRYPHLSIKVISLYRNLGHQKAIAIGMSHLANQEKETQVLVMDADGEDKPSDIPALLEKASNSNGKIIFAKRSKRSEGLVFRVFYLIYKSVFKLLTGKTINFGNFSLVPSSLIKKVAFLSEIWNNYPGGIIKSRLPFTDIGIDRGKRLAGESKMNFISLVLHGMSTISVFLETTAVRILVFAVFMVFACLVGISVVLELKFIEEMATPGWASNLAIALFIVILQGFFISLFLVFMVLNHRGNKQFIPFYEYENYIESIQSI